MKIHLSQKLAQKMALTPQMRQSIHILQLPLFELKTYLEQQIEENPAIEDLPRESELKERAQDLEIERLTELIDQDRRDFEDGFDSGHSQLELRKKQGYQESLIIKQQTLHEHLLRQLRLQPLNKADYKIGELLIGEIDENGYFQGSLEIISENLKVSPQNTQSMLSLIQTFEPSGAGSRNLKECLLIQLNSKGKRNSLAYRVVEKHLVDLAKNKVELIARQLKVTPELIKTALKEISALEPKPGRAFHQSATRRILPDVIVEKRDNDYEITVNGQDLPSLKISSQYKDLLKKKDTPEEVRKYLKERLGSAMWLARAVSQRQETISRVAEYIVQKQREFFEHGYGHLKPLTMKEVAQKVERNESTISRVVNSKYIQTPYGVFGLSYFFSGSYKTDQEGDISANTVKTQIASLIDSEDGQHPLSDAKVVSILRGQGLRVARRTIAKYREELKILPSYLRKK